MSKRAWWEVEQTAGHGVRGGGDVKRALGGRPATDVSAMWGEHVMCLIMSYLPAFAPLDDGLWWSMPGEEEEESLRKIVRSVCKTWRARRYDQWIEPRKAYALALQAGNEEHANRLWAMRRDWIGAITVDRSSLDMFNAAAAGNVLRHLDMLFEEIASLMPGPKEVLQPQWRAVEAALQGAARGGHLDVLRYVMHKHKCSSYALFSNWRDNDKYDASTCRDPWSVAIRYGHVHMVQYFIEKRLKQRHNVPQQLGCGLVLAAMWKQTAIVDLLWSVRNVTGVTALYDLYDDYKKDFTFPLSVFNKRFFAALSPRATPQQRHYALHLFAQGAPGCAADANIVLAMLPTVTDQRARSKALQLALQHNVAIKGERIPLKGAYGDVIETLKEYAFDNMRTAKLLFECAAKQGPARLVRYMLSHEKSTQLLKQSGVRALQSACQRGNVDVVQALVEDLRIDPRASNNLAMRSAWRHNHEAVVAAIRRAQMRRLAVLRTQAQ